MYTGDKTWEKFDISTPKLQSITHTVTLPHIDISKWSNFTWKQNNVEVSYSSLFPGLHSWHSCLSLSSDWRYHTSSSESTPVPHFLKHRGSTGCDSTPVFHIVYHLFFFYYNRTMPVEILADWTCCFTFPLPWADLSERIGKEQFTLCWHTEVPGHACLPSTYVFKLIRFL